MSEPIPESIPTSADPRSRRPVKRARLPPNASKTQSQANEITYLFENPDQPIILPPPSTLNKSTLLPPPEIVANVQGSSAGAGSGEFHVYKASRRREYERLRLMSEEAREEDEREAWEMEEKARREADEERTRKKRAKRNKKKAKEKGNGGSFVVDDEGQAARNDARKRNDHLIYPLNGAETITEKEEAPPGIGVANVVDANGIVIHDDD